MSEYNNTARRYTSDIILSATIACGCFWLWVLQPAAENQTQGEPKHGQRYREALLSKPQVPEPAQRHREAMTRHAAHGAPFPFLLWHSRCQDASVHCCAHCTAIDGNTRLLHAITVSAYRGPNLKLLDALRRVETVAPPFCCLSSLIFHDNICFLFIFSSVHFSFCSARLRNTSQCHPCHFCSR